MSLTLHLKRQALEAINFCSFAVNFPSKVVKFNKNSPTLLLHTNSFQHLSVGDQVGYDESFWLFETVTRDKIVNTKPSMNDPVIAGFIELTGKAGFTGKCQVKHIFCILVAVGCNLSMGLVTNKKNQVLLFWPESLVVEKEKYIR